MTTHLIELSSIHITPERIRKEFDPSAINELADSIGRLGLLNAPVVDYRNERYELVAGERRLRAISDLYDLGGTFEYNGLPVPAGLVPVTRLSDLSPIERMEAELEENTRRRDLSWQEKSQALAQLAELRTAQAAQSGLPPPKVADLAVEVTGSSVGSYQENTRRSLILANHLDKPEVAKAKTADEAWKALKRQEQTARNEAMAKQVGLTFSASVHQLYNEDCISWLRAAESEQYDVILTDPPYGISADEFGYSGGKTAGEHAYEDSEDSFLQLFDESNLPVELFRVAKPNAHLYLFCDISWFSWLLAAFSAAGWRVFRTPLIWYKPSAYRAPWPEHGPQRKYEMILYAMKGTDKKVNYLAGDVITCPPDDNLGHQAQKPVGLFVELLKRSAQPGQKVLDPFCGSGPIFPAAHQLKLAATGIEAVASHYGLAARRLAELK